MAISTSPRLSRSIVPPSTLLDLANGEQTNDDFLAINRTYTSLQKFLCCSFDLFFAEKDIIITTN
jgi:hypothetical protein